MRSSASPLNGGMRPRLPTPPLWRVVLLFTALTVVLAYPLSIRPADSVMSAAPDTDYFLWALSWDVHALTHQPLSPFEANIDYPEHRTLAYSENLIGSAPLAAPILWLTGNAVLAMNLIVLASGVLAVSARISWPAGLASARAAPCCAG